MLERLRGAPLAGRRPRMLKTLELRAQALRVLHRQQIGLLKEWRAKHAAGDEPGAERCCLICSCRLMRSRAGCGLRGRGGKSKVQSSGEASGQKPEVGVDNFPAPRTAGDGARLLLLRLRMG